MSERKRAHVHSQSGDPDTVYFNATVNGAAEVGVGNSATLATVDIQRSQPIIGNPRDYFLSVIRATVPMALVPILVVPHIGATDVTPYVIGIRFGAAYFTSSPLVWVPEQYGAEADRLQLRYHMRSYASFASMVNAAMAIAYAAFSAANPGAPQAIAAQAPFVYFDAVTDEFVWVYHDSWNTLPPAAVALGAAEARITANASLLSVFDGWRMFYPGDAVNVDRYADFVFENDGSNAYTLNGYVNTSFSRPTVDQIEYMSSMRRIVITSATLPITPEGIPTVGAISDSTNTTSATLSTIADYVPQLSSGGDVRSIAYYTPDAMWRICPLISDEPISRIALQFWWQASSGELYPILIPRGQQCSVKLAFAKKDVFLKD